MAFPDVDLACLVARQFPGWKERLRFTPPQLRWKGGWRQIRAIHPESSGVCLILEGGEAVRLDYEPADGAREEHLRDLVQYVLADNPGFAYTPSIPRPTGSVIRGAAFLWSSPGFVDT